MIPRLQIEFPLNRQAQYWLGCPYRAVHDEYLLNHARTGIIIALRSALPNGGRVGVVAYNCHTVANAVVCAGCTPVFLDVTEQLMVQTADLNTKKLDAIVLTNLFGIRNDVESIRKEIPEMPIIVDNAHGYGLPAEGDFTVYSINQGKFPALGEGGILCVNSERYARQVAAQYATLPDYSVIAQIKLFGIMLAKAMSYSPLLYSLITLRLKASRANAADKNPIKMQKMANGVRRMYAAWLPTVEYEVNKHLDNAEKIKCAISGLSNVRRCWYGENAFMLIAECNDVELQKRWFAEHGVETETHFKNAIRWAKEFGYRVGDCPVAEALMEALLMVPTYKSLRL